MGTKIQKQLGHFRSSLRQLDEDSSDLAEESVTKTGHAQQHTAPASQLKP